MARETDSGRAVGPGMSLLFERPAATREGGAIHANGARGTRPVRPVSRALRRPPRVRPEPVGRPLGEHGDERQRELSEDAAQVREDLAATLRYRALLLPLSGPDAL